MGVLLAALALLQGVPDSLTIYEAGAVVPPAAKPKDAYVRVYLPMVLDSQDDLPFTTMTDGMPIPESGPLVVGVFVLPGVWSDPEPPTARVATDKSSLPFAVHGGCRAVNLVLDPVTGRTLASWCNVDAPRPETEGLIEVIGTVYTPAPSEAGGDGGTPR